MPGDKASEILQVARATMMERGYNGFSFRDIAADVGIKSASIHYHYPTKADLAAAAARAYRENFANALESLKGDRAPDLLRAYGNLFVATLKDHGKACLGGVLAVDAATLPQTVQDEVRRFFEEQHRWIGAALRSGQKAGEIRPDIDPDAFAEMFVSSLEGAMLIARALGQTEHLENTLNQLANLAVA